jgi:hypothetical protein
MFLTITVTVTSYKRLFMNKKWMPITAVILDIINGTSGIVLGSIALVNFTLNPHHLLKSGCDDYRGPILILGGIVAILGVIGLLKMKRFSLAIIAAIGGLISASWLFEVWVYNIIHWYIDDFWYGFLIIPAIVAIILTILSRKQFEKL